MKPLLLLASALAASVGVARGQAVEGFVCDIPTSGCTNGMFNQAKCECECIPPFCHDMNGDCQNPSGACGGNPWTDCTRGVNCPWWANPLKAESCTAGPKVPAGLWQIYSTRKACCGSNFAYSTTCDVKPEGAAPTRYPTIAAPEEDFEVVPIKFDVRGLPDDLSMRELKDEMLTVLKRILLRLSDRISGLRITSVEENILASRNLEQSLRMLLKDVSLFYNVHVVRDDDKKFGPLIIQEMRDIYEEVLDQIQTFTDTKYFGTNLNMNLCTSQNGQYTLCIHQPARTSGTDAPSGGGGLPGWAVAIIVILVLSVVFCLCYYIYCSYFRNDRREYDSRRDTKGFGYSEDSFFANRSKSVRPRGGGKSRTHDDRNGSRSRRHDSRSRRTRRAKYDEDYSRRRDEYSHRDGDGDLQIVLSHPQDPKFDEDNFTINTYGTRPKARTNMGRDPTMYIPGQEDKPDPEANILAIEAGPSNPGPGNRRYYTEDPDDDARPKREPTMYIDGQSIGGRSLESEMPSVLPPRSQRDPSMYVDEDGPSMYGGASARDAYNSNKDGEASLGGMQSVDPFGMGDIDEEEEYDQFGFRSSVPPYAEGQTGGVARDPSHFDEDTESFRTREPSVQTGRSKKKKKKKRSSRSDG